MSNLKIPNTILNQRRQHRHQIQRILNLISSRRNSLLSTSRYTSFSHTRRSTQPITRTCFLLTNNRTSTIIKIRRATRFKTRRSHTRTFRHILSSTRILNHPRSTRTKNSNNTISHSPTSIMNLTNLTQSQRSNITNTPRTINTFHRSSPISLPLPSIRPITNHYNRIIRTQLSTHMRVIKSSLTTHPIGPHIRPVIHPPYPKPT